MMDKHAEAGVTQQQDKEPQDLLTATRSWKRAWDSVSLTYPKSTLPTP